MSTESDHTQSDFEYELINLSRLDLSNHISTYSLPYRVALNSYLNDILMLNGTTKADLIMPYELLRADPTVNLQSYYTPI